MPDPRDRRHPSITQRKAERELFFWTAFNVLKLILGQSMLTVIAGVVIGIAGSFLLTRTMQSLLFGVSATDPVTLIAVALLLTTVALLASYVPARSATRVDPIVALRYE